METRQSLNDTLRQLATAAVNALEENDPRLNAEAITQAQRDELKKLPGHADEVSALREALALYVSEGLGFHAEKQGMPEAIDTGMIRRLEAQVPALLREKDITSYAVNALLEENGLMPQETTDMIRLREEAPSAQATLAGQQEATRGELLAALQSTARQIDPAQLRSAARLEQVQAGRSLGDDGRQRPSRPYTQPTQPAAQA